MTRYLRTLIFLFLCAGLLFTASCASNGVLPSFVGFANFSGNGDVRTDGNTWLAIGNAKGEAGVFVKGSGFPVTQPFLVEPGYVYVRNIDLGFEGVLPLNEPLPAYCATLFRPGEIAAVNERFGVTITFEPPTP